MVLNVLQLRLRDLYFSRHDVLPTGNVHLQDARMLPQRTPRSAMLMHAMQHTQRSGRIKPSTK